MSIWSTRLWLDTPIRDQHGRETPPTTPRYHTSDDGIVNDRPLEPGEGSVDVSDSGMSDVIRLTVAEASHDRWCGGDSEVYITADEARRIAAALIASADKVARGGEQ